MNDILKSARVVEFFERAVKNNWMGTLWEKYILVDPKQKGGAGEIIVEAFMKSEGHTVEKPQDAGHDRIVNGFKCEIKFSLACSNSKKKDGKLIDPDSFIFNHIGALKSWEKFIFCGINPEANNKNIRSYDSKQWPPERLYIMCKEDFVRHINGENPYPFSRQQGGKKTKNDDWMVSGRKACLALFALPFVKEYKGQL